MQNQKLAEFSVQTHGWEEVVTYPADWTNQQVHQNLVNKCGYPAQDTFVRKIPNSEHFAPVVLPAIPPK